MKAQSSHFLTVLSIIVSFSGSLFAAENWPQFRGPRADGLSESKTLPVEWDVDKNIAWMAEVPGLGWSSPVLWGGKIFLTTVTRDGGEEKPQMGLYLGKARGGGTHHYLVLCYDSANAKELWRREVHAGEPRAIHLKNSYASATPVADAQRVVALFHDVGLFALDHDGKPLWNVPMAVRKTRSDFGHGGSPTLHDGRVYLVDDNEEDSFAATYDVVTGKELWHVKREPETNYATPFVWTESGPPQLVVPATKRTVAYDLAGKEVWGFTGGMSLLTICTPFAAHGLLFVGSGYFQSPVRGLFAIKPGAKGDITPDFASGKGDAFAWFHMKAAPYNPSPLVYGDELYVLYDQGMISCYDARTGQPHYEKMRLSPAGGGVPGGFTASPWAHAGEIFCLSERAETFVVKAGPRFELLRRNALPPEPCLASPALVEDSIILRTASKLYRIQTAAADAASDFTDSFRGAKLAAGWTWQAEVPGGWKLTDGALHLRSFPGNLWAKQNNARNIPLCPLRSLADGAATTVTLKSAPTAPFEQAGLIWLADDDHYIKIIREHFGGADIINFVAEDAAQPRIYRVLDRQPSTLLNLKFADGRPSLVRADDVQSTPITLEAVTTPSVQLRLRVAGNKVCGEFRTDDRAEWQLVGECPLLARPLTHAGLLTLVGPKDAEHWVEFRDFKITTGTH